MNLVNPYKEQKRIIGCMSIGEFILLICFVTVRDCLKINKELIQVGYATAPVFYNTTGVFETRRGTLLLGLSGQQKSA